MTRREFEAAEQAEVEASHARSRAECEAEELSRLICLPKGHPARLKLYSMAMPTTRACIREGERLIWRFRHPFADDLTAVASTNC